MVSRVCKQLSESKTILCSVLLLLLCATQIKLVYVTSPSIPYRLCLQVYNMKPHIGDLCVLNFHGRTFLKYLVGMPGDRIENIKNHIYVGGAYIGLAETNNMITPISNSVIPDGYVFVAGTHENSFDSRYKEFGLVQVADIRGRAFGLMRW